MGNTRIRRHILIAIALIPLAASAWSGFSPRYGRSICRKPFSFRRLRVGLKLRSGGRNDGPALPSVLFPSMKNETDISSFGLPPFRTMMPQEARVPVSKPKPAFTRATEQVESLIRLYEESTSTDVESFISSDVVYNAFDGLVQGSLFEENQATSVLEQLDELERILRDMLRLGLIPYRRSLETLWLVHQNKWDTKSARERISAAANFLRFWMDESHRLQSPRRVYTLDLFRRAENYKVGMSNELWELYQVHMQLHAGKHKFPFQDLQNACFDLLANSNDDCWRIRQSQLIQDLAQQYDELPLSTKRGIRALVDLAETATVAEVALLSRILVKKYENNTQVQQKVRTIFLEALESSTETGAQVYLEKLREAEGFWTSTTR